MCLPVFRARVYFWKVTVGWLVLRHCLLILFTSPLSMYREACFPRKGMETVRIQAWCTVVAHACNPHTGRMCEAGGSCIPYYTVKHYLKNRTRILRVGWAAMCNWCSCRGPMFSCQNTLTLSLSLSQLHTHTHISEEVLPSCHSGIVPKALCLLCATRALPLIFALGPSYHACVC